MWTKEYHRQWRQKHSHPCKDCGKIVGYTATRCFACAMKWKWAMGQMMSPNRGGSKQWKWKGGRAIATRGYILILNRSHPRANKAGYVLEHILIWEQTHGKPLPKGWIIHHLNGITSDNRPVNLVALPNKKHYLLLESKAKRIQELEALLNNQHQLL